MPEGSNHFGGKQDFWRSRWFAQAYYCDKNPVESQRNGSICGNNPPESAGSEARCANFRLQTCCSMDQVLLEISNVNSRLANGGRSAQNGDLRIIVDLFRLKLLERMEN
tara:strand:- start:165306 stop:165632 length:327 start_codon:yes stop_codon:yes gene_type:complete